MIVYFDASIRKSEIGVGIYCETTNERHTLTFPISTKDIALGEFIAFREAMRLYPDATTYYTDNQALSKVAADMANIVWVPREYNKEADKLSKKLEIVTENNTICNIAHTISKKYTFDQRLNLWSLYAETDDDYELLEALRNNTPVSLALGNLTNDFCFLIRSTFNKNDEIDKSIKLLFTYLLGTYKTMSDGYITRYLNRSYYD